MAPSAGGTLAVPPDGRTPTHGQGTEYAELLRRVRGAGLLDRRPGHYAARIAITATLFGAGWAGFVLLGDSWWQLAIAGFLAFVFTQIGFIGHDAGHRQIFRSKRANYLVGLLHGNLAIGLSYGWWVGKHSRHHAHPNHDGRDPDIHIGALAFTTDQARAKRGLIRFVVRHQRLLFFPLLLLEAVHLHVSSIRALLKRGLRYRSWEAMLLVAHLATYLGIVFFVLSPVKAIAFVLVQQALFGLYLGLSFAPNHKGMPILAPHEEADFLRRQVLTSRNVRGGAVIDFMLGGLNYQIEHHLFPSMPRPNLRGAQHLVRGFCQQHDVSYLDTSLWRSYGQALRHLHQVGRPGRSSSPA